MFYVLTDNSEYGLKQIQAAMVSIHSDEENRFVSRMSGHHIWLAASNINRFVCKKPQVPGWSLHRRLQGSKTIHHNSHPVGSDEYLVFNQHQLHIIAPCLCALVTSLVY